jgi:putative PIN family toxin of toxin-antitoxin system
LLRRPRISEKYALTEDEIAQFLDLLLRRSMLVVLTGELELCLDRRDNMVLETAIVGGAKFLVSRDDDIKHDDDLIREMQAHGRGSPYSCAFPNGA